MKRIMVLVLIFFIAFASNFQYILNATNSNGDDFEIGLDESTEEGQAVLHVTPKNEGIKGVMIELPSETTFDKTLTQTLNENRYELTYEKEKHLTTIEWGEDFPNGKVYLALTDIEKESNKIYVEGFSEDQQIQKQDFSFEVDVEIDDEDSAKESKAENEEIVDENTEDEKSTDLEVSKNNENDESDDTNTQSEEKATDSQGQTEEKETESVSDTKQVGKEKDVTKSNKKNDKQKKERTITPFIGDLNTDIDITPYKETVESGKAALYKLVLKTTGSQKLYEDSTLTVKLPITDYTQFTQDVNELEIAGVLPVYNEADHTLVYEFNDQLRAGETYEKIIKVKTENLKSPNGAELNAIATLQVTDKEQTQEFIDDATVKINSSGAINISKEYIRAEKNQETILAPTLNSYIRWEITVDIPKKDIGQMYLKEGSKIVITDTLPQGIEFTKMNRQSAPQPTQNGNKLTWEFDAPSLLEQAESDENFFTQTLTFWTKVDNDKKLVNTKINNTATATATFIDGKPIDPPASANAEVGIFESVSSTGDIQGTIFYSVHYGPKDGKGGQGTSEEKNPNPPVHDDAYLHFYHGVTSMHPGQKYDMDEYRTIYTVDENLILDKVKTPGDWIFARSNPEYGLNIPLARDPEYNLVLKIDGKPDIIIENAKHNHEYTRSDLGLSDTDQVTEILLDFTYAPAGMHAKRQVHYYFNVKPGYIGEVENRFNVRIKPDKKAIEDWNEMVENTKDKTRYRSISDSGIWWYRYNNPNTWDSLASDRHATIVPKPTNQPPIATVGVELLEHHDGQVHHGENRMKVRLKNESSSTLTMTEQLESVVLLPPGVTLNTDPNATYTDNNGKSTQGQYEIISDDFNGSGRQLIKIKWNEDRIRIGEELTAELDVSILEGSPNTLIFDVYGFSGDEELRVPSVSGDSITNTILQTDDDDLNGDGVTDQPRIKSGNIYTIQGEYDLQTEKFVKGELDEDWNKLGQTTPGGHIDYKLHLTNTTGKDITTMTLIDVLPSVGDLGITDNISRGSKFTPTMKGPITLPSEWEGKVKVFYSEAKTPKRDDLIRHTKYPETTTPLSNPEGAESPNWMTEADVEDWNTIHSFKIELIDGETWVEGTDMEILFSMKAPEANDVDASLLDKNMEPKERAAWNSFAVATDHGQPVEPAQVGVYMNYEIEEPEVEKTVNEQKETYELINRNEQFTWEIKYEFGNHTGNWESVSLSDQINELLEIGQVTVIDQNGTDVTDNGDLTISENNLVTFDLKKKDGSFKYLQNQTYTMIIESQIKESVKNEELLPYIKEGGIPNQAELIINDDPKPSNEVKVKPPALKGSLQVIKQDKEDNEKVLEGAAFELLDEEGQVVAQGETDSEGKLVFRDLPLGKYQLVETKAPEGYRLLKKPLDVEITSELLEVELEVENSKTGWDLPLTGGIGTLIFYGLGALLMVGALFLLFKRKKTTEQIEK